MLDSAQRIIVAIVFLALGGIALVGAQAAGLDLPGADGVQPQAFVRAAQGSEIALISGHAGNDSGAVCEDDLGNVSLTEASINARVAESAADRLRRAGASVTILNEFDPRLENLQADVLVSLHADSCIDASGFKAAVHTYSAIPNADAELLACIGRDYPLATGLPHHPNTVTHNMTEYHAFRKIAATTPAAILELGFLGGDRFTLESNPDRVAEGVANSILCFLRGDILTPVPEIAADGVTILPSTSPETNTPPDTSATELEGSATP
jgi:N-acetylmuramoyl-L-alanine amidase